MFSVRQRKVQLWEGMLLTVHEWRTVYFFHIVNSCSKDMCNFIIERDHSVDEKSIPGLSLSIIVFLNWMKKVNVILQGCPSSALRFQSSVRTVTV